MQDKIVINDYIENDPLSEENLDKTLETVNEIRLLFPNKSIWIYTGYTFEQIMFPLNINKPPETEEEKRIDIIKMCDVLIDGRYIDSQRNPQSKWRGSSNQRVISVQQSFKQNEIVLYCN